MRARGTVTGAGGLVPFGHLGWAYSSADEFLQQAGSYLRDALEQHQQVEFVGAGDPASLRSVAGTLPGAQQALDSGQLTMTPLEEFYVYAEPGVLDVEASLARRRSALEAALSGGWTGARAIIDATANALSDAGRDAAGRFELAVDAVMATAPVSALCAYDSRRLPDAAVTELVCLHPFTPAGQTPLQAFRDDGADLAFDGDLGTAQATLVARCLRHAGLPSSRPMIVDVLRAGHVAPEVLQTIDDHARTHGTTIVLRGASPQVGALIDELALAQLTAPAHAPSLPVASSAGAIAVLEDRVEHLTIALRNRDVIGQAKGVLMARLKVTEDGAFALLVGASQHHHRKLRDIADTIARTGSLELLDDVRA